MNTQSQTAAEARTGPVGSPRTRVEDARGAGITRRVANRLRNGWGRIRPFPRPRYASGTPKTGSDHPLDPFFPPNIETLASAASSKEAADFVLKAIEQLTPSEDTTSQKLYYHWAQAKFGEHWLNADITTLLWAASTLGRPANYLEIGVRRGRSAALVAAAQPDCAIYGFDLWVKDYGGGGNPGPDFVRGELSAVGHRGTVELFSGNSRVTLPAFLRRHPQLYFDLITIDGDHSVVGAATDLANALPRLKVGGIVVCDDVCVPSVKWVWEKIVKRDSRYVSWEFTSAGYGVGAAIRITDEPALAARRLV